jgi:uncharacterized protein (DUF2147 family)
MKFLSLLILCLTFSVSGLAQEDITGVFWTPDKDGKIKVYKSNGKYYAKLTWIKDLNSQKSKKPNGESTLGEILLKGFEKKKENLWTEGVIIDPTKNKEYSAKLWLDENNNLVARGFVGISLLGKTVVFQRVK